MKKFTTLCVLCMMAVSSQLNAQLTVSWETFPNNFNVGASRPIDSLFQGDIGLWRAYSSDSMSTVTVNGGVLKLYNWAAGTCHLTGPSSNRVTSPVINCHTSCVGSGKLTFDLYTHTVNANSSCFKFLVKVSGDGGATWTTLLSETAQHLNSTYGQGTWHNISLTIPASLVTSNFRYQFVGIDEQTCMYENFLYIDNPKVIVTPCPPANLNLGNLVWDDVNINNVRDASEPGIANATVKLYRDDNNDNMADGAAIAITSTDASGKYNFSSLTAGNYIVGVIIPAGHVRGANSTVDPDTDIDNDNNGNYLFGDNQPGGEVRSKAITLAAGTEPTNDGDGANGNLTLDIGLCEPAPPPPNPDTLKLGNMVWADMNCNNTKDASDMGIAGATVKLYKDANNDNTPDGAAVATTITNSSGMYMFSNLAAGNYIVGVMIPTDYMNGTGAGIDPDNNVDNDNNAAYLIGTNAAGSEVRTKAITLAQGTEPTNDGDGSSGNLTLDIALCPAPPPPPPGPCPNNIASNYGGFEGGSGNFGANTGSDLYNGLPRNGSYQVVQNVGQLGGGGYLNITPRTGNWFFASHTSNNLSDRIWYTKVAVTAGQTYQFCIHPSLLKNLGSGAKFIIGIYANGMQLDTGRVNFGWSEICGSYTVPAGVTTVEFSVRDPKKGLFFVALDDICITKTSTHRGTPEAMATGIVEAAPKAMISPNPAGRFAQLSFTAVKEGTAEIRLVDAMGRIVSTQKVAAVAGANVIHLNNLNKYESGMYNVQVMVNGKVMNERMFINNK